jgi:flagellar basal body-associated protein FliL
MDAPFIALFYGLVSTAGAVAVGYGLFNLIKPKNKVSTPIEAGKLWLAWSVMLSCAATLSRFFIHPDIDHFLKFLIALFFFGLIAFCAGWGYLHLMPSGEAQEEIKKQEEILRAEAAKKSRKRQSTSEESWASIFVFVLLAIIIAISFSLNQAPTPMASDRNKNGEQKAQEAPQEQGRVQPEARQHPHLEISDIIVNLNSPSGEPPQFLKISLKLELDTAEDQKKMKLLLPQVVDQIQIYLRKLRIEDLRGTSNIYRLKIELLSRVRATAPNIKVRDVLFQEILVQ